MSVGCGWAEDAVWYQIFPERFRNGAGEASNPRAQAFHQLP